MDWKQIVIKKVVFNHLHRYFCFIWRSDFTNWLLVFSSHFGKNLKEAWLHELVYLIWLKKWLWQFFCLLTHILTIILYCISFRQARSALPKPVLSGHSHNPWQGSPRHEMRAICILVSLGGLDMCLIDMCLIICG